MPILTHDEYVTLELFEKTVAELTDSRAHTNLLKGNIVYEFSMQDGTAFNQTIIGLDEEELKAFILTCRLLVQNNERTSIQNISQPFERLSPCALKTAFNLHKLTLNSFLDGASMIQFEEGGLLTLREIFNAFCYGLYAHRSRAHHETIQLWMQDKHKFQYMKQAFLLALSFILKSASLMAECCRNIRDMNNGNGIQPPGQIG